MTKDEKIEQLEVERELWRERTWQWMDRYAAKGAVGINYTDLLRAVARGWTHRTTSHIEMDVVLAKKITDSVMEAVEKSAGRQTYLYFEEREL